jgi:hypothetical protein
MDIEERFEVYVPMGSARFQQRWCHTMLNMYRNTEDPGYSFYPLYKKILTELYRKEYYEKNGWNFTFRLFRITVVEIGLWVRTYHRWTNLYGEKETVRLPKVRI